MSSIETEEEPKPKPTNILLTEVEIKEPMVAVNVMVGFLTLAQRRGAFSFQESAKIYECIKFLDKMN
jgi:hypothetical protein